MITPLAQFVMVPFCRETAYSMGLPPMERHFVGGASSQPGRLPKIRFTIGDAIPVRTGEEELGRRPPSFVL
jgi:hypothetical protein